MALYALFLLFIRHRFLGNEQVAAKSYLFIIIAIPFAGLVFMAILNIKMMRM